MRKSLLTCFIICACYAGQAQNNAQVVIDSLVRQLRMVKEDTTRIKIYYDIAGNYIFIDPAKAMQYADTGMAKAEQSGWKKMIAHFDITRGNILGDQGKTEQAIALYLQAQAIFETINDPHGISSALNDIGGAYFRQSDYTNAIAYYSKALKIAEEIKDDNLIGTCYTNFSTLYFNQKNYAKAIEYSSKSLEYYERINNPDKIARSLNYIGNVYLVQRNLPKAEEYYTKALKIYEKTSNKTGMAILYSQIAILYEPDYKKIITFQEKSQAIWDEINPRHNNSIINMGNMGESYLNLVRSDSMKKLSSVERTDFLNKAASYLQRAIRYSHETNDKEDLAYFSGILAEQQEISGDYKTAVSNYRLSFGLKDSLYSQENKNKIASIEGQREIDLRDKEIQISKLALASERKTRIAMIIGLGSLLVIGILLYWQSRTRKRTNTTLLRLNNELDEANKVKARFFAILSHDLRSPVANLISFLELQEEEPDILDPVEAAAHQKTISHSAKSLLETMETMLLWSKGQMENFKPQIRSVAVSEMYTYIQRFFTSTGNVSIHFSDPGDMRVSTDENYLQTIMHNLTANALKVLKNKPGSVIDWRASQEGEKTILSITDNGPGVNTEQAKALYDDSAAPNARTGFGLHLVRDLAKAIKCKITMRSEPGVGTTFTLLA